MRSVKYFDRVLSGLVAIAFVVAFAPTQVVAQDDDPGYTQVRTMAVKGGRMGEYLELQKQFAKIEKAAGRSRGFWQEIRGDGATFYSVRTLDKLGDNDDGFNPAMGEDEWSMWIEYC